MPVFVPFVLIGVGVAGAAGGALNAYQGTQKVRRAKKQITAWEAKYEDGLASVKAAVEETNSRVAEYGEEQERAASDVVRRMADFIRRHEQQVTESAAMLLDGIVVDTESLDVLQGQLKAPVAWKDALQAGAAGVATYTGLPLAVASVAHASTGTAISTLGGAAAKNATLAWLGGGSLAAGGGGIALGAAALNFVTIGPTLFIGGLALNKNGEKALTQAKKFEADVRVKLAEQVGFTAELSVIDSRVAELRDLLGQLSARAVEALDELESEAFDPDEHVGRFQLAITHAVAVRAIIGTPVLNSDGALNSETEKVLIRYRKMT